MERPLPVVGPWSLERLRSGELGSPRNGLKVFSCFHCGGGSSMGYKLAGFDVLGGVEIDPEMMDLYRKNFSPKHSFLMGVQDFLRLPKEELPPELFELDVLDGSPPCSSFSMAGSREADWGKEKKFREGQTEQVLDDLFFSFVSIAGMLRPKVVVAENVKGLLMGKARGYVKEIFAKFREQGYDAQLFLLNSSRMGVPQSRERVFFIARRSELGLPAISLDFSEDPIAIGKAFEGLPMGKELTPEAAHWWALTAQGSSFSKVHPRGSWFGHVRPHPDLPHPTIVSGTEVYHYAEPRYLSDEQVVRVQSFPDDYDFGASKARYVCGMSVPPLMMQRVALEISRAFFSRPDPT